MTATDTQVRIAMRERARGKTREQAAAKANLRSRQTVAKYEELRTYPSEMKRPRAYRTHADDFAEDWPEIEAMLQEGPELEAKALFEWLCEQKPEKYRAGQLRTFQRRVEQWRGLNQSQVASLDQVREPGETIQLDGTWLTELEVTIRGELFKHLLIHCVLPYSNWEWGRVTQSESLSAVRLGLQSSLRKLGYVPESVQTDNSAAATRRLGVAEEGEAGQHRDYTAGYLQLLEHYGLKAESTHVASPNENGDVEAQNGVFKRALKQQLLLRGSRDFDDIEAYEAFLFEMMEKRNRSRQPRVDEEIAVMRPVTATPLATSLMQKVRVSRSSVVRVLKKTYSVPTSLIGKEVTVHIQEWTVDVYYAGQWVERLPRAIGEQSHHINYRHIIDSLLRKPGGFRGYRFREDLFPRLVFRQAWEQLQQWHSPRRADLLYLQILHLAARTLEEDVAIALELLVQSGQTWSLEEVKLLLEPEPAAVPLLETGPVELGVYDQLLAEFAHEQLRTYCKALRLPTLSEVLSDTLVRAERESWPLESCLLHLLEQEVEGRRRRRIERLMQQSQLPPGKTLAQFDYNRLPLRIRRQLANLEKGDFVDRSQNVLFFGLPGTGKTHTAAGLGHALIETGRSVLFIPTFKLVGRLLAAKRDYELERELRRLDRFDVVILDDIGYVQQSREEMEVLFTFLAERYERRSLMITSNLVFSEWDKIFKDPLTTAAAIDRIVHHSIIVEFGKEIGSLRMEEAARRNQQVLTASNREQKDVG